MAQRCTRSFWEPIQRVQNLQCTRSYTQTLAQQRQRRAPRSPEVMGEGPKADRARREFLSHEAEQARFANWEPKTREEAKQRWKAMQDTPDNLGLLEFYKIQGVEPIKVAKERGIKLAEDDTTPLDPKTQAALDALRTPINIRAIHLRPLRREPTHGVPVCDLQMRSYSIRNLLLFSDFAVRAAYYMGLPCRGPIPLPRITERWTVPRSNFIFKKSQENFERITMRRLIQIQDGHPDVVKAWLAFLQKHMYWGIGMKANIYEFEDLESAMRAGQRIEEGDSSRRREGKVFEKVKEILGSERYREGMKGYKMPADTELRM